MPKVVIDKFKGVNTTKAKLQLQPGEMVFNQNVRNRPVMNLAKRKGIDFVSSSSDPVWGILDFEFPERNVWVILNGSTLSFQPSLAQSAGGIDPSESDGYPTSNPLAEQKYVLFLLENVMRAANERFLAISTSSAGYTWPKRRCDAYGNVLTGSDAVSPATVAKNTMFGTSTTAVDMPVNNFYKYDLAWADSVGYTDPLLTVTAGSLYGTFAAGLVNLIVSVIEACRGNYYINVIDGEETINYYDTALKLWGTASAPTATSATYATVLSQCKSALQKMLYVGIAVHTNSGGNHYKRASAYGTSIADAIANAQTAWATASYTSTSNYSLNLGYLTETIPGTYLAIAEAVDFGYWYDARYYNVNQGTTWQYIKLDLPTSAFYVLTYDNSTAPIAADKAEYTQCSLFGTIDFANITTNNGAILCSLPNFTSAVPTKRGWTQTDSLFVLKPNFVNTNF